MRPGATEGSVRSALSNNTASRLNSGPASAGATPKAAAKPTLTPAPAIASRAAQVTSRRNEGLVPRGTSNARLPLSSGAATPRAGGAGAKAAAGGGGSGSGVLHSRINTLASGRSVGGAGGAGAFQPGASNNRPIRSVYNGRGGGGSTYGYRSGVWRGYYNPSYRYHYPRYYSPAFTYAVNYAYRPTVWGNYTWWGARSTYSWYYGSWDYGWNRYWNDRYYYYRRPASYYYPPGYRVRYSTLVPWGLASWSLGRLAYDTGYYSYYNPYIAPPVTTQTTVIRYVQPITVVATEYDPVSNEPVFTDSEKSSAALDRARAAFQVGDYVGASAAIDEAISFSPGDPVLHEFRALVYFALGRYNNAAGILNSVLASGPGWSWSTMIGFYGDPERYTEQFRKLEAYVIGHPDSAEAHFLLGYHYMVGESLPEAYTMFDQVVTIQPADTVARQLRSLLADSAPESELVDTANNGEVLMAAAKAPIENKALYGIWKASSSEGKLITLSITEIGTFTWNYEGAPSSEVLNGEWSLDDDGLLVLKDDDVQMVGDITLNPDGSMHFLLAGSPEGDPGLTFHQK